MTTMANQRTTSALLLKNSAWNVSANIITGAAAFLLVPFMLRHLGEQSYGVWVLIGSAFAYSGVLGLGLSSAINRYIPVSLARGTDDDIRRVTSTGTVFFCGVGLLLAALTMVLYWGLTSWFHIPAHLAETARATVLVVGAFASIAVVTQGFEAVLSGYQRYDLTGLSRVTMVLLRAAVVVALLIKGAGLLTVACVYGFAELGTKLMNYFFCTRLAPRGLISLGAFDAKLLREMLAYGINTFLYGTGTLLTYKASELIIGFFLRPEDVALYSVAATGVLVLSTTIISLCAVIKPATSDLDARGDDQSVRELAIASQKYTLFLILPSTAFLVIMGREFLRVWTRLDTPQLPLILALLAVSQAIQLAQHSNFVVMVGKGEHRFFGACVGLIGVSTVGLGVLNTGVFHWGLLGVAVANLLPLIVVCGVIIPAHVDSNLGLSWRERVARVWKPVTIGCFPSLLLLFGWEQLHPPGTWREIGAIVVLTFLLTAVTVWRLGLNQRERSRFMTLLQQKWPKRWLADKARLNVDSAETATEGRHPVKVTALRSYIHSHTSPGKGLAYDKSYEEDPLSRYFWGQERSVLGRILAEYFADTPVDLLDFACGTGRIIGELEDKVRTAKGVDVSDSMLQVARAKLRRGQLYKVNLIRERLFKDGQFNLITAFRFFPNAEPELRVAALQALEPLLSRDGYFVFNNHQNHDSPYLRLARFYARKRGFPLWSELSMAECRELLDRVGFDVVRTYPVGILHIPKVHLPNWLYRMADRLAHLSTRLPSYSESPVLVARRRNHS